MDMDNVSRGIAQLDSMMNNLMRRKAEVMKQEEADTEEMAWIDHSLHSLKPKAEALKKSLAYKLAVRAELVKMIEGDKKTADSICKESADVARRALSLGRSLYRREASNRLEFQRGYSTKVNTTEILRGRKPTTSAGT